jgi:hypothetical protein
MGSYRTSKGRVTHPQIKELYSKIVGVHPRDQHQQLFNTGDEKKVGSVLIIRTVLAGSAKQTAKKARDIS